MDYHFIKPIYYIYIYIYIECPVKHPRVSTRGIFKKGFKHRKDATCRREAGASGKSLTVRIHFFKKTSKKTGHPEKCSMSSGQIITTSAEVTLNGGLIRELPQNPLNSGLGTILICPDELFCRTSP